MHPDLLPPCLIPDPTTSEDKCDRTCRPEEECRLVSGTWGCFCREDLNVSGERWDCADPAGRAGGRELPRVRTRCGSQSAVVEPGSTEEMCPASEFARMRARVGHISRSATGLRPQEWVGLTHEGQRY